MKENKAKTKITKSFWKILRISLLLLTREIYLFIANLYGLFCHPFLTLKNLKKNKDFSQEILVFGLPGYLWLGAVGLLAVFRLLIGIRGELGWIAQLSFVIISLLTFLLLGYLLYWLFRILKSSSQGKL